MERVTDWGSTSLRLSKILKMNSITPVITCKASLIFFQLTYNHNPKLRDLRFGIQLRLNKLMMRTWGRYCKKLTRLQRVRDKTYTIAHTYSQLHTRLKITVINNEFPFHLFLRMFFISGLRWKKRIHKILLTFLHFFLFSFRRIQQSFSGVTYICRAGCVVQWKTFTILVSFVWVCWWKLFCSHTNDRLASEPFFNYLTNLLPLNSQQLGAGKKSQWFT